MQITLDVVITQCTMSLEELNELQTGHLKPVESFIQSEVMLKSGHEVLAKGVLMKVNGQFCVSIEGINAPYQSALRSGEMGMDAHHEQDIPLVDDVHE